MADSNENTKSLLLLFSSLPEDIREWLASERATYFIGGLGRRFELTIEKQGLIARLILQLVVQDLDPQNFINELSRQLEIGETAAKTIVRELEENILKPIEKSLRENVGVDIKLIHFIAEKIEIKPEIEPMEAAPTVAEEKSVEIEPAETAEIKPLETKPEIKIEPPPPDLEIERKPLAETPFILHQEKELKPIEKDFKPSVEYREPTIKSAVPSSAPVITKLESPEMPDQKTSQPLKQRVVHYSGLRTPPNSQ